MQNTSQMGLSMMPSWALGRLMHGVFGWPRIYSRYVALIWRVGDGERIKIWKDRWIPYPHRSYRVQSPRKFLDEDAIVADLIDKDTRWWNTSLINEVFMEDEASAIFQMSVSLYNCKD